MKFTTKAIHVGQEPDPCTGAITIPIYQTSTYVQQAPGRHKGFDYSRATNPTRSALEKNLASLEDGRYGLAFASGMAAVSAVTHLLESGDHAVVCDDVYGGVRRLFHSVLPKYGLNFTFADLTKLENLERSIQRRTKLVWIETPSNPLLKVVDIRKASEIARQHGAYTVVDNTFATPYLQNPLKLGADIVVHSTTKYLGGHSDIIGGALVTSDKEGYEKLKFIQKSVGAVPSPFDCWLVLRGVKTLAVRMEAHCENARMIAEFLERQDKVSGVLYPGLMSHPQYELAKKQMRKFGGMISFKITGRRNLIGFLKALRIISLAESLGGVESMIDHPASMTHASISADERNKIGITDDLVRLSVGIEDAEDLIDDLRQALRNA